MAKEVTEKLSRDDLLTLIKQVVESKQTELDFANQDITELPDEICELLIPAHPLS